MNKNRNKLISMLIAILFVLSTFLPSLTIAASDNSKLANGEYTIDFSIYKDGTTSNSVMDGYANKPAKLFVNNGEMKIQVTFKNADWIHAFDVKKGDTFVPATIINEDSENKLRTVEFAIADLESVFEAKTHVIVPIISGYDHWYDVDIAFHKDSITVVKLDQPVEEPNPGDNGSEDGEDEGTDPGDGSDIGDEKVYSVDFSALRADNDNASSMDSRFEKPATVKEKGGKKLLSVALTEKGKEYVTGLELQKADGTWVAANSDFKIVDFEIANVEDPIPARVSMEVPMKDGTTYKNTQNFRVVLTSSDDQQDDETEQEEEKVYSIDFSALRADNDNASSMDSRFEKPATVKEKGGKKLLSVALTEKGKEYVTGLELQKADGTWVAANGDFKIVDFEIVNVEDPIPARVSMEVPMKDGTTYKNTQNFRIVLNAEDQQEEPVDEEEPIDEEKPEDVDKPDGQIEKFSIDFNVFKNGTNELSVMDDYTEKPAILTVENGKNFIYLTLTSSKWIKAFKTEINGEMKDTEVIKTDKETNKRVVKFEVADPSAKLNAYTEVFIPSIDYDGKYTVQFQFDVDSKKPYSGDIPTKDDDQNKDDDKNKDDDQNKNGNNNQNKDDDRLQYPSSKNKKNTDQLTKTTSGNNPKTNDPTTWFVSLSLLVVSLGYIIFRMRGVRMSK